MTHRLTQTPVPLMIGNTPAWQLWAQLAQFARHLQPTDWVLVGGQMVALHCHVAGITPGRATTDIDIVAKHLSLRLAGRDPVPIEGGYRALQRAAQCAISTEAGEAIVPVPDLQGAFVLKARAYVADSRDRGRHQFDLAQLCTAVHDPMTLAAALDRKELRALRRVGMPLTVTQDPWLRIDTALRADALEAWQTLASGSAG